MCTATINDPNGLDNFSQIKGEHFIYHSNIDVKKFEIIIGNSPSLSKIMCQTFPNVETVQVNDPFMVGITKASFEDCSKLVAVEIQYIHQIDVNAFVDNSIFNEIIFRETQLATLPLGLFDNNPELIYFEVVDNLEMTSLPDNLFDNNSKIQYFYCSFNNLQEWSAQWLQNKFNLQYFWCKENHFSFIPPNAINSPIISDIYIGHQPIKILNSTSFGDLSELLYLNSYDNDLEAIDVRIFNRARSLRGFEGSENVCINEEMEDFEANRDQYMEILKPCFEAFGIVNLGE